ncbi:ABC transporter permease [Spiroplasma endosymbiont of Aspidapion aeneum]|uniref:ABC transporter permease n=1 Tax=Spiroplasma endosymbiont of Aspidapion aeneum TaxID=3066276 RepID=UPI00313AF09B
MNKIFKNYLKNFIKNWVETFGFLIFIISLFCALFGVISSPLQNYIETKKISRETTTYDRYFNQYNTNGRLNSDFVYEYIFLGDNSQLNYVNTQEKNEKTSWLTDEYREFIFVQTYATVYLEKDLSEEKNSDYLDYLVYLYDTNNNDVNGNKDFINMINFYNINKDLTPPNEAIKIGSKIDDSTIIDKFKKTIATHCQNILSYYEDGNSQNLSLYQKYKEDDKKVNKENIKKVNKKDVTDGGKAIAKTELKDYDYDYIKYIFTNLFAKYGDLYGKDAFNFNYEQVLRFQDYDTTNGANYWKLNISNSDHNFGQNSFINKIQARGSNETSQLVVTKGSKPNYNKKEQEIVISDAFAKSNNLNIGQTIKLNFKGHDNNDFKIVGIGNKLDFIYPIAYDMTKDKYENYGNVFMPAELLSQIISESVSRSSSKQTTQATNAVDYYYLTLTANKKSDFKSLFLLKNKQNIIDAKDYDSLILEKSDLVNYTNLKLQTIQIIVYFILSIVVIGLAIIFINFIIKKELNQTRKQIGIFKASGYGIRELAWIFTIKVYITIITGIIIGYLISIPLQIYAQSSWQKQTTIYIQPICYKWEFLLIIFGAVPLIISAIAFCLNYHYLKENIISLINNTKRIRQRHYNLKKENKVSLKRKASNMKFFGWKLMNRFTQQSWAKFLVVNILMLFTSLITFLEISALDVLNETINANYTQYNDKFSSFNSMPTSYVPDYNWNLSTDSKLQLKKDNSKKMDSIKFLDYSSKQKNQSLESYIINNNLSSNVYAKNIRELLSIISDHIKSNPESLYVPTNLNQSDPISIITTISKFKPVIFTLLLAPIKNIDDYFQQKDPYASLWNYSIQKFKDLISAGTKNEKLDLDNTLLGAKLDDSYFYLKDISRLSTLMLYDIDVQNYISNSKLQGDDEIISNLRNKYQNKIDISNPENWSLNSDISKGIFKANEDNNNKNNGETTSESFSKLTSQLGKTLSSLLTISEMVNQDNKYNPILTIGQYYYDSKTEVLSDEISVENDDFPTNTKMGLYDFSSYYSNNNSRFKLGNPNSIYNFYGVNSKQFKKMGDVNSDGSYNSIVSLLVAKYANLSVGDECNIKTINNLPIKIKVVGISKKMNFLKSIFVDYKTFLAHSGSNIINYDSQSKTYLPVNNTNKDNNDFFNNLPFTTIYSQKQTYTGKIDITNIAESISKLKYVYENMSIGINKNSSLFYSMLMPILENIKIPDGDNNVLLTDIIEDKTNLVGDKTVTLVNDNSLLNQKKNYYQLLKGGLRSTYSLSIEKSVINDISSKATIIIYLFIALTMFLVIIILVVVLNIIIDESIQVILTLKAMGYRKRNINLIVLGNYIVSGIIFFIMSWFCNFIIWKIVIAYLWNHEQLLLSLPITFSPALINFFLTSTILIIGYFACDFKNRKYSITRITE